MKLLFAVLLCFVALVAGAIVTHDNGITRSVNIIRGPPNSPHAFEARAQRVVAKRGRTDAVQIIFSTNWVPRFVFRFFEKTSDAKQMFATRWCLWRLIEYEENGTPDGYVPNSGDIVRQNYTLMLRNDWTTMEYTKYTSGDATVHQVCTRQPAVNPVVELCGKMATASTSENGVMLSPNRFKWSLNITRNFPYLSTTSRLALQVSWDTLDVVRDFDSDEQSQISAETPNSNGVVLSNDATNVGVATWLTKVDAVCASGVQSADVTRTIIFQGSKGWNETLPSGDDDVDISRSLRVSFFSFLTNCPQPGISWDPDMGVSAASGLSMSFLFVFAFILLLL